MSTQLISLSAEHAALLKKYLLFFEQKKEGARKEVAACIRDLKDDAMENQIFTKKDVERIFESCEKEVVGAVKGELDRFYKMSGVFV